MFCIASFIVFAILGIFSVSYRKLAGQAWHCVKRRVTLKPCDINFSEEVKGKLLGKLIIHRPHLAKFLNKWFDWLAFVFVILSIWSLVAVLLSALNLWVYDTCSPSNGEACSLSGDACGLERPHMGFIESAQHGLLGEWFVGGFVEFGETVSRVPDRFKNWKAEEYLSANATFYYPLDQNKKYAVEATDPSCLFCKQLFENFKEAGLEKKYNYSYVIYPIPSTSTPSGYRFPNSYLMSSYIEATKLVPLNDGSAQSPDWRLLEMIFTGKDSTGVEWQKQFNEKMNPQQAEDALKTMLGQIGYNATQIEQISLFSKSEQVKNSLLLQKDIIENKLKTVKIPTLVFNGRRFDRVVDSGTLQ